MGNERKGRGGYSHGHNWKGVTNKEKTTLRVPSKIAEEVKQFAQDLWEEKRNEENSTEKPEE